jgi:predicted nucleic acid-binding protein
VTQLPVIIDTNILFSALLREHSSFAQAMLVSDRKFYLCESVIIELFKHKEKIIRLSQLSEEQVITLYHSLIKKLELYKEHLIKKQSWDLAYALCKEVDPEDTPHLALTIELNGLLWTGDKKLKQHLIQKGFTHFFFPQE